MDAVIAVCCFAVLVSYGVTYALGAQRGLPLLLGAAVVVSGGALMAVGQPLVAALVGAVVGAALGTALTVASARIGWRMAADGAPAARAETPVSEAETRASRAEAEPASTSSSSEAPASRRSAVEPASPPKAVEPQRPAAAAEPAEVAAPLPAAPSPASPSEPNDSHTRPLGTVDRQATAALEEAIRKELSEPPAKRPSVVPRGVFGQEETPIALTQRLGSDALWEAATENLDEEIAPSECPRCGHRCRPEERYCAACSAPVLPWKCKTCGHRNAVLADFCVRCQTPLELLASPFDVQPVDD
ncbi:MAG: hypothetical protein AAF938_17980 [Myxococcota bacterium]